MGQNEESVSLFGSAACEPYKTVRCNGKRCQRMMEG